MSQLLKLSKLAPRFCRLMHKTRLLSLSALQLQNLKDEPTPQRVEALSVPENLSQTQRNLLEFVTAEIIEERRVQLQLEQPYVIDGFTGHFSGSKVELVRETPQERINIFFNVSKSVPRRCDESGDLSPVRSVPKFEVLIRRNDLLLSIFCVYKPAAFGETDGEGDADDVVFEIQDLSLYKNGWNDSCFTIDASLIDDNLQSMLLHVLEEKGITQEFARRLSDMATAHEHALYIEFLENLSKFTVGLPPPLKADK